MKHGFPVKKWALTIASVMTLGLSSYAQAVDLHKIEQRGVMSVATEDNYSPFNYIEHGQVTGINKDLLDELKKYSKFEIKQDILPWTGLLAAVGAGQYDFALTGAIISDSRLKAFDFTPPIASAQHFIITRAREDKIHTLADLDGKTVGVQSGSVPLERLPELKAMLKEKGAHLGKVKQYQSCPDSYADLVNGRVDYVIDNIVVVNNVVKSKSRIFKKGFAVSGEGYVAWPVPKNNPELLAYLTKFFDHLRTTGRLAELQNKWFGEEFNSLPTKPITSVAQFHQLIQPKKAIDTK